MKTEFGTSWIWIVFWNTLLKEMVKERWKGWEDKEKGVMSVCWITLKKSCWILKEETLDRTLWRTRFWKRLWTCRKTPRITSRYFCMTEHYRESNAWGYCVLLNLVEAILYSSRDQRRAPVNTVLKFGL